MTYEPYSVVVVPFPFTDSPKAKKRPALVLSALAHQRENGHISLAMITSAKHSEWYGDVSIIDLEKAGLSAASIVRQKIFTIDQRLIERTAGSLSVRDHKAVAKALRLHFPAL